MAVAIFLLYLFLALMLLAFVILSGVLLMHSRKRKQGRGVCFLIKLKSIPINLERALSRLFEELTAKEIPFSLELVKQSFGEEIQLFLSSEEIEADPFLRIIARYFPQQNIQRYHHEKMLWLEGAELLRIHRFEPRRPSLIPFHWKGSLFSALSQLKTLGHGAQFQILFSSPDSEQVAQWKLFADEARHHELNSAAHVDQDFPLHQENVDLLESRLNQPLHQLNINLLLSAENKEELESLTQSVLESLQGFHPHRNSLRAQEQGRLELEDFLQAQFDPDTALHLSSEEIGRLVLPEEEKHHSRLY